MSIEQELRQQLLLSASVAELVGKRVYYLAPQAANAGYPRITLTLIGSDPVMTLSGAADLKRSVMQVESWAEGDYGLAKQVAEAAHDLLTSLRGDYAAYRIDHITQSDDQDDKNPPVGGSGATAYRVFAVYDVWHAAL